MDKPIIGFGTVCFNCRNATPFREWQKGIEDFFWYVQRCPKCGEVGDCLRTPEGRNMAHYLLQCSDEDLTQEQYAGFY